MHGALAIFQRLMAQVLRPHRKQLRTFVGLTCYYLRFIPHFVSLASRLTDLTRSCLPAHCEVDRGDKENLPGPGGELGYTLICFTIFVIVSTTLQVSPICPFIPCVFISAPAFPPSLFSHLPGFWPLPVLTLYPPVWPLCLPLTLTLSLPAVLYLYPCCCNKHCFFNMVCIWVLPWYLILKA
jgi:hypothetical protein